MGCLLNCFWLVAGLCAIAVWVCGWVFWVSACSAGLDLLTFGVVREVRWFVNLLFVYFGV